MATLIRYFVLRAGLKNSNFAATSATHPYPTLFILTSGVSPISSVTSLAIFMLPPSLTVSSADLP
nr:hypothetical protein [Ferrithrix thermotolerans]